MTLRSQKATTRNALATTHCDSSGAPGCPATACVEPRSPCHLLYTKTNKAFYLAREQIHHEQQWWKPFQAGCQCASVLLWSTYLCFNISVRKSHLHMESLWFFLSCPEHQTWCFHFWSLYSPTFLCLEINPSSPAWHDEAAQATVKKRWVLRKVILAPLMSAHSRAELGQLSECDVNAVPNTDDLHLSQ